MKRFNKENVKDHIALKMQRLEKEWGFDPNNGTRQVDNSDFERVLAYGEYQALDHLYDVIEYNLL
jgi:hypothetical protein